MEGREGLGFDLDTTDCHHSYQIQFDFLEQTFICYVLLGSFPETEVVFVRFVFVIFSSKGE